MTFSPEWVQAISTFALALIALIEFFVKPYIKDVREFRDHMSYVRGFNDGSGKMNVIRDVDI